MIAIVMQPSCCLTTSKLIMIFLLMLKGLVVNTVKSSTVGLYGPDRYEGLPEVCLMPMDMGYCRAKVQRYYFDVRRMKCSMFYWGGCAGNDNNFQSIDECIEFCIAENDETTNNVVDTVGRQTKHHKLAQQQLFQKQQKQLARHQLKQRQKLRDYDFHENIQNFRNSPFINNTDDLESDSESSSASAGATTRSKAKYSTKSRSPNFKENNIKTISNGTIQNGPTKTSVSSKISDSKKDSKKNDGDYDY